MNPAHPHDSNDIGGLELEDATPIAEAVDRLINLLTKEPAPSGIAHRRLLNALRGFQARMRPPRPQSGWGLCKGSPDLSLEDFKQARREMWSAWDDEPGFAEPAMKAEERKAIHDRWIGKHGVFPSQLPEGDPVRTRYEDGHQCLHCVSYVELSGPLGDDWGACTNPESGHDRTVVFEHFTCAAWSCRPEIEA